MKCMYQTGINEYFLLRPTLTRRPANPQRRQSDYLHRPPAPHRPSCSTSYPLHHSSLLRPRCPPFPRQTSRFFCFCPFLLAFEREEHSPGIPSMFLRTGDVSRQHKISMKQALSHFTEQAWQRLMRAGMATFQLMHLCTLQGSSKSRGAHTRTTQERNC